MAVKWEKAAREVLRRADLPMGRRAAYRPTDEFQERLLKEIADKLEATDRAAVKRTQKRDADIAGRFTHEDRAQWLEMFSEGKAD